MAKRSTPINVRSDQPDGDRLGQKLAGLRGERGTQFLHTMQRMNDGKIPAADCEEVLNARYETYPLKLGDGGLVLLADWDSAQGRWTLLEIVMVGNVDSGTLRQGRRLEIEHVGEGEVAWRLYDACCAAHGLTAPARESHVGGPSFR